MAYKCIQGHYCAKRYAGKRCPDCSSSGGVSPRIPTSSDGVPVLALTTTVTVEADPKEQYRRFQEIMQTQSTQMGDPATDVAVLPTNAGRLTPLPPPLSKESLEIAGLIASSLGESTETGQEILRSYTPADTTLRMADRVDAVRQLSTNVPSTVHQETFNSLVRRVETGDVVLTQNELDGLVSIRDSILTNQVSSSLAYRTGEWEHSRPARNCTLCGQFISERVAHTTCNSATLDNPKVQTIIQSILPDAKKKKVNNFGGRGTHYIDERDNDTIKKRTIPGRFFPDGKERELYQGRTDGLNEQEVEDVFSTWGDPVLREAILVSYMDKSLFGKTYTMTLPDSIRSSLLDSPGKLTPDTLAVVAATIEPPFTSREIEHLVDVGGPQAASALLQTERTRQTALDVIEASPSDAGAFLAQRGQLPDDTIRRMVTSPDPLIRREAAIAPNLDPSDQDYLVYDPDEDVRLACIDINYGYQREPASDTVSYDRQLSRRALVQAVKDLSGSSTASADINEWDEISSTLQALKRDSSGRPRTEDGRLAGSISLPRPSRSPAGTPSGGDILQPSYAFTGSVDGRLQSSPITPTLPRLTGTSLLEREPRYMEAFVADPQSTPRVISAALSSRPYSRQAYAAIATVTDPARLATIQEEYDRGIQEVAEQRQENEMNRGHKMFDSHYSPIENNMEMAAAISTLLEERRPSSPHVQFERHRTRIRAYRGRPQIAAQNEAAQFAAQGYVPNSEEKLYYCLYTLRVDPETYRGVIPDDVLDASIARVTKQREAVRNAERKTPRRPPTGSPGFQPRPPFGGSG